MRSNSNHFFGTCNKPILHFSFKGKKIQIVCFQEHFFYFGCSLILNNVDLTMLSVIYAACMEPLSCILIWSLCQLQAPRNRKIH